MEAYMLFYTLFLSICVFYLVSAHIELSLLKGYIKMYSNIFNQFLIDICHFKFSAFKTVYPDMSSV